MRTWRISELNVEPHQPEVLDSDYLFLTPPDMAPSATGGQQP